ncbi:hypothetical protein A176_003747 [Myxococcus hansupus]|uniref:Uncharacterized protein n=1 Tax=Pseudomyxococcus hansupus TaxID=1297742 RepID=A0A0H4WZN8_9BACT|nr:hypothetical protein [Myxococcus hansupus]AKQ66835.1 hypothetical protein A176_003747 [Myxococcus hansupus]
MQSSTRPTPPLAMNRVSTLTHGMPPGFVQPALENGRLSSAFHREGPDGRYHRPADRNGGGALGVYTRAQGKQQDAWQAQGYGVGSNPNNVQMVLDPNLLQTRPGWRASSIDNMGKVPGASQSDLLELKDGNPLERTTELWSKQTEPRRNQAFNTSVSGRRPQKQNEQVHWEHIPLDGNLRGMVTTSPQSFNQMMQLPGAWRSGLPLPQASHGIQGLGYVPVGNGRVPVVQTTPTASQANALKLSGITDTDGNVR